MDPVTFGNFFSQIVQIGLFLAKLNMFRRGFTMCPTLP